MAMGSKLELSRLEAGYSTWCLRVGVKLWVLRDLRTATVLPDDIYTTGARVQHITVISSTVCTQRSRYRGAASTVQKNSPCAHRGRSHVNLQPRQLQRVQTLQTLVIKFDGWLSGHRADRWQGYAHTEIPHGSSPLDPIRQIEKVTSST